MPPTTDRSRPETDADPAAEYDGESPYSPVGRVYPSAASAEADGGGHLVVFDPAAFFELSPLSLTRPVFALRCGIDALIDNQVRHARPTRVTLWVRPALEAPARRIARELAQRHGVPCDVNAPLGEPPATMLDGRTWWYASPPPATPGLLESDESRQPLRWILRRPGLTPEAFYADPKAASAGLGYAPCAARVMRRWWDLVAHNVAALARDAESFAARKQHVRPPSPGVHLVKPEQVYIGRRVTLSPGCVLDASGGPVCLDDGASVGANAVLVGPCYVGPGSGISPLALLKAGANVGPGCKVGGEVANSIFQGHANKSHAGYVGDSYVGEWANLGAGTTTSNLKNTYGPVRAATPAGRVDTGRTFLGSVIGDHAKLGIGTMLAAGTHVGVAQVAVERPPPFVGHLRFLTSAGDAAYRFDKFAQAARRVTARRGVELTADDLALLHGVAADD